MITTGCLVSRLLPRLACNTDSAGYTCSITIHHKSNRSGDRPLPLGDRNSQVVVLAAVSVRQEVREGKDGRFLVVRPGGSRHLPSLQSTSHMEGSAQSWHQSQHPPALTLASHLFCFIILNFKSGSVLLCSHNPPRVFTMIAPFSEAAVS